MEVLVELLSRREQDPRMELLTGAAPTMQPALHPSVEHVAKQKAEPAAERPAAEAEKSASEEPEPEAQPNLTAAAEPATLASEA